MSVQLSAAQAAAVGRREGRLAVVAGAGSGKTTLLVERYLAHVLEDRLDPASILTVTFTRKAAAEMRERIVRRLEQLGRSDLAQAAETGPVQTLHGFCERLLRENAFDAEIDPRFTVVEGALAPLALERAFQHALLETAEGPPCVVELVHRLGGEVEFAGPHGVQGRLYKAVSSVLEGARGSGIGPEELLASHTDPDTVLRTWASAIWSSSGMGGDPPDEPGKAVAAIRAQGGALDWGRHADDRPAAEATAGLVHLAVATWKSLEGALAAARQMDFTALEHAALKLVEGNEEVSARLRRTYRALLVDEAQDVNPVQHRLLAALGIEPSMVVGDAAQSIFAFRGAEPEHFLQMPGFERAEPLAHNHRSRPEILAFVDHVFSRRWGEAHLRMEAVREPADRPTVEVWDVPFRDSQEVGRRIARLVDEGWRPGQVAVLTRVHRTAAAVAAALRGLGLPCTVTGGSKEFFLRLEVRDLANVLTALADPGQDYALLASLRSPLAGLSLDSVVLLAKGGEVWPQLDGFEPPLAGDRERLDRFLAWYERTLEKARRLSAWEVLSAVLADSPYLEELASLPDGHQRLANVRKLLRIAAAMPESGPLEFAADLRDSYFLRSDEYEADVDPGEDSVSLMTLHASKGLEFDVVVLPDVHSRPVWRTGSSMPYFDRAAQTAVLDDRDLPGAARLWAASRDERSQREELWRLWYVGMTRARELLCLCVSAKDWGRELGHAAGFPDSLPPYVRVPGSPMVQPVP